MGDNLIPSSTPEKGRNEQPTTNSASEKHDPQPEEKLSPTQTKKRKKARFTTAQWLEFLGSAAWCLWLWADLIECRDVGRLRFLVGALLILHSVFCYLLAKLLRGFRMALGVWILLGVCATVVVYKNSRANETAMPAQEFPRPDLALVTSHNTELAGMLTNESLFCGWKGGLSNESPYVMIPISNGESSVALNFIVKNKSQESMTGFEILVILPKTAKYERGLGWSSEVFSPEDKVWRNFRGHAWKCRETLEWTDSECSPPITFATAQDVFRIPFVVMVTCKQRRLSGYMFWLSMAVPIGFGTDLPPTVLEHPKFVRGPDGQLGFVAE
ncbi:MAG: hypothetical protein ABSH21_04730 [Verrucomicrobiia bacterium]